MNACLKYLLFVIILFNKSVQLFAQCTIDAGPDHGICPGDSIQLNGSTPGLNFYWTPSIGLSDTSITNPIAKPAVTTTYHYISQFQYPSLIFNGDFSSGNTGFTSGYTYKTPPNTTEGQYWVASNPQLWNNGMSTCGDHTTGNGNMMIVNGSVYLNVKIWCVGLPVTPNTDYAFSCWLTALYSANPARLQFTINNVPIGNIFNASSVTCQWQQFYVIWNSGTDTVANICISNQNSIASGNDFALDDISFSQLCTADDSVTVFISKPIPAFGANPLQACDSTNVIFADSSTGALSYSWDFGDQHTSSLNSPSHVYGPGNYNVSLTVTDSVQCTNSVTKQNYIQIQSSPVASFTPTATSGCDSLDITFINTSQGAQQFEWNFGNGKTSQSFSPNSLYVPGKYTVSLIAVDSLCSDTAIVSNLINVEASPVADYSSSPASSTPVPYMNNLVHFTNQSQGASTYRWEFGDSTNSSLTDPDHSFSAPGDYDVSLLAYTLLGCSDTITSTYHVFEDRKDSAAVYIPNSFTPNGDNVNDIFTFTGYGIDSYELNIFNKWGEIVFSTNNIPSWDGQCNGEACPQGTYVYHLHVNFIDNSTKDYSGKLTLIR
jgi:gliding motility-associated-like protein